MRGTPVPISPFRVAAAQVTPIYLNREQTVDKACFFVERAAAEGARFVVFPETFIPGYPDWVWVVPNHLSTVLNPLYARLLESAVTLRGEAVSRLCAVAKEHGVHICIGVHERNDEASGASLYNTLLFIDDTVKIAGRRRKLMPTGAERLVWAQGDGAGLDAIRTPFAKIGGLICWENLMPLARQALYNAGVEILAAPTWDRSDSWIDSMRHIAREGGAFVISCCMPLRIDDLPDDCGFKEFYPEGREWINAGKSCVINPKGKVIAGPLDGEEGLVIAEVDLTEIASAKRMFDVAGHYARPDVFRFSVNRPGGAD